MNEPRRWLDSPDALSLEELRVLEAGLEADVPKGAKDAVKRALLAQLPAPAPEPSPPPETITIPDATGVATGVSTVATATAGAFLKSTAIGFALGVGATASWVTVQPGEERDRGDSRMGSPAAASVSTPGIMAPAGASSASAPTPSSDPRPRLHERDVAPVHPPLVNAAEADTGSGAPPAQAPSISTFPETFSTPAPASSESSRLARARALLRNNDASAAFAALESLRRDHPHGLLIQEREVLSIEALQALGHEEAARTRAQDFLTRHPKSPHAASARRVLDRR